MGRRDFGSVRKLPSGRWQATYFHKGERHTGSMTFGAKADATAWLASIETDIRRGGWVDPRAGKVTLAAMLERWLASNPSKRSSSLERDRSIIENHLPDALTARAVATIGREDIQALVDTWAETKAASTVGRQYSAIRAAFSWAEASDIITRTPCRAIRLPKVELVDRPVLAVEQLQRLAETLGPDQAAFMWLGAVGGLRWAEVAGLTVGTVVLPAGVVKVTAQLRRDGRLGPPKSTAGRRSLAVPTWLAEDLAAVIARRGLTAADSESLVFVDRDGGPLDYTNWRRRMWARATKKAGLVGLKFHDLRSMAATALVAQGVDIKTAQTRLGHSSPQVTLGIYARATVEADRLAAEKVGAFFGPSRTDRARPGA
ncbi:MAG TPA: site-specific integrase [Acidimicrobiales bacterium]|nr:site-specific integrase [Acidimicrobiales bacterium]